MSVRNLFHFDAMLTPKVITVGGAIGARIWCELMIVLFKLNENVPRLVQQRGA